MNVTMNASSSSKSVKRDFMTWATKWFYADIQNEEQKKPDIASLIGLFQSIGYKLRTFEKSEDFMAYLTNNSVRITLECGSSGMKAVLESCDVDCKCPNIDAGNDASFWSVTGTKPIGSIDSINKFEETGSSLLPRVPKTNQQLIHDVIHFLLSTIKNQDNAELNTSSHGLNTTITTSKSCFDLLAAGLSDTFTSSRGLTQPELVPPKFKATDGIYKSNFANNLMIDEDRRKTFGGKLPDCLRKKSASRCQDTDKKRAKSPVVKTKSPGSVKDLCSQFTQISEENKIFLSVAECLRRAKYYIEKAQVGGGPPMPNDIDDDVFVKPMTPVITAATSRHSSLRKSPAVVPKREIINTTVTSTNYLTTQAKIDGKLAPRRSVSGFLLNTKQKETSPASAMRRLSIGVANSASQLKSAKSNTSILKRPKLQLQKATNSPRGSPLMRTSTLTSISSPAIKINTTLTLSGPGKSSITPGKKTQSSLASSCGSLNTQTPKNRLVTSKNGATGSLSTGKKLKAGGTSAVSSSTKTR